MATSWSRLTAAAPVIRSAWWLSVWDAFGHHPKNHPGCFRKTSFAAKHSKQHSLGGTLLAKTGAPAHGSRDRVEAMQRALTPELEVAGPRVLGNLRYVIYRTSYPICISFLIDTLLALKGFNLMGLT